MTHVKGMDLEAFGKRLAAARDRAGYSQEAVGDAVGKSQETVSRWEGGISPPPLPAFVTMCQMLHADPAYLLTGKAEAGADTRRLAVIRRLADPRVSLEDVRDVVAWLDREFPEVEAGEDVG